MNETYTESLTLEKTICCACGMVFAVPKDWIQSKRDLAGSFWCPNGHALNYQQSESDRLKKQLEIKERELRESKCETLKQQQLLNSETASRLKSERKLKRVSKGVCPCCNRSFANLARHMESKHSHEKTT